MDLTLSLLSFVISCESSSTPSDPSFLLCKKEVITAIVLRIKCVHAFYGLNKCFFLASMFNVCGGDCWLSPLLPLVRDFWVLAGTWPPRINYIPSLPCNYIWPVVCKKKWRVHLWIRWRAGWHGCLSSPPTGWKADPEDMLVCHCAHAKESSTLRWNSQREEIPNTKRLPYEVGLLTTSIET